MNWMLSSLISMCTKRIVFLYCCSKRVCVANVWILRDWILDSSMARLFIPVAVILKTILENHAQLHQFATSTLLSIFVILQSCALPFIFALSNVCVCVFYTGCYELIYIPKKDIFRNKVMTAVISWDEVIWSRADP